MNSPLSNYRLWIAIAIGLFASCVAISLLAIPFDVSLRASIDEIETPLAYTNPAGDERSYSGESLSFSADERIRNIGEETIQVEIIQDSNAYAYVLALSDLKITDLTRRGTAVDHLSGSGEYEVMIEQTAGTVVYDLSASNIDKLSLSIHVAEQSFQPSSDCFQVTIEDGLLDIPCGPTPTPEATLPSLQGGS